MQSRAGLVFRALLLLGCLLVLPLVAICGSSLPDMVQTALEGRWPTIEPSPAKADREAPQFVRTTASGDRGSAAGSQAEKVSSARVLSAPPVQPDQIERRLQQLGASYYRLEEWGNQAGVYRFICEMPIGNDPRLARSFEAIHADRMEAMADVLRQVEAFCGG
jgi:hypothetical protein